MPRNRPFVLPPDLVPLIKGEVDAKTFFRERGLDPQRALDQLMSRDPAEREALLEFFVPPVPKGNHRYAHTRSGEMGHYPAAPSRDWYRLSPNLADARAALDAGEYPVVVGNGLIASWDKRYSPGTLEALRQEQYESGDRAMFRRTPEGGYVLAPSYMQGMTDEQLARDLSVRDFERAYGGTKIP